MQELPEFHAVRVRDPIHRFEPNLLLPRRFEVLVELVIEAGDLSERLLAEHMPLAQPSHPPFEFCDRDHETTVARAVTP